MTERFDPFIGEAPRWYAIEAHRPFLEDLASGVLDWMQGLPPEALADAVVLLPNRRAARAFTEALSLRAQGRTLLLPQVRPLGDLEEDEPPFAPGDIEADLPPAISALQRRFELARMIVRHHKEALPSLRALEMAEALAGFMDSCQIEEVTEPGRVKSLVEADLAAHWQDSAAFLSIAVEAWPARLRELGLIDPQERKVRLLKRLAATWSDRPPQGPIIAAGSTGTVPSAAEVIGAVARSPQGCVVLPGLDLDLESRAWDEVGDQHPQGALKALLARHEIDRSAVRRWPAPETEAQVSAGRARRRLIAEALKPPRSTADWREAIDAMQAGGADPIGEGLSGLSVLTGRTEEAVAALAAVLMREAVETPGRTCALVTPDAQIARRVQARLGRWGLEADSSAGTPLSGTPTGVLLGQIVALAGDGFGAVGLLALLKHPLVSLGLDPADLSRDRDDLERHGLRGPHPADLAAIRRRLEQATKGRRGQPATDHVQARIAAARTLLGHLERVLLPVLAGSDAPRGVDEQATHLAAAVEAFAGGPDQAWRGAEGEAAARLLAGLIEDGAASDPMTGRAFADLLQRLMDQEIVRTGGAAHPRLRILGAIEARLVRADRVILAGLEEGVWPRGGGADPFLSRPMRSTLGLPSPERRVGLSAHDFAQAACAPEVILLHAERRGGQPSVRSRWLWRLETLVKGAGLVLPGQLQVEAWARALDRPAGSPPASLKPATRPSPTPPTEARPTRMSVTRIEEWVRDPYATYARFILKLFQLERPDERVDARIRGTAIHKALETFSQEWDTKGGADGPARFSKLYLDELLAAGMAESALAREAVLGRNAGVWVTEWEASRRAGTPRILLEQHAEWVIPIDGTDFTLTADADRVEVRDGKVSVIDFKTGSAPSAKQVKTGFSSQLPLTAAMARAGAFGPEGQGEPAELLYVSVTGRNPPARIEDRAGDDGAAMTAEEAVAGLVERVRDYARPSRGYGSRTAPAFVKQPPSDYDHLARVAEWSTAGDGEEG